ncbi:MAG: hypothetical protein ABSG32_13205 [Terriglobia bacterium]|jgi:hypothetical protein
MDWSNSILGLSAPQNSWNIPRGAGVWLAQARVRLHVLFLTVVLLLTSFPSLLAANHSKTAGGAIDLSQGWRVLPDVHDSGERMGLFRPDFNTLARGPAISDWEPIPRLAHLQLLFAPQPYFGRELRYLNEAPWWYRLEFATPAQARQATLRFEGVDYFAKVFLNGHLFAAVGVCYSPKITLRRPLLTVNPPLPE